MSAKEEEEVQKITIAVRRRRFTMSLECCRSLCKIEEYDYLDDVQIWLWELYLN